jgi:uncharacterized protein (TIGR03437 family)
MSSGLDVQLEATGIRHAKNVQVFVGGQTVTVRSYGALGRSPTTDQVTIAVPLSLAGSGETSVYIVADGATSNMTTINIQ